MKPERNMVDFKALAESKGYRLTLDESWYPDCGEPRDRYWQIPCQFGHIYPHGANTLGAFTDRTKLHAQLSSMGKRHQCGDQEITVIIGVDQLDAACDLLRAKRKRKPFSEEERARRAATLASYKFHAKRSENQDNGEAPEKAAV